MVRKTKVGIVLLVGCFLAGCTSMGGAPTSTWYKKDYCTDVAAYTQGVKDAMRPYGRFDRYFASGCGREKPLLDFAYGIGYYDGLHHHSPNVPPAEPMPY